VLATGVTAAAAVPGGVVDAEAVGVAAAGVELPPLPLSIEGTSNARTTASTTESATATFFIFLSFASRRSSILFCLRFMKSLRSSSGPPTCQSWSSWPAWWS